MLTSTGFPLVCALFLAAGSAAAIPSSTILSTAPNPSFYGQSVTLTAAIPGATGGTVSFSANGSPLGSAAVVAGVASLGTGAFAVGAHSLTATFSGDGTFDPSTSAPVTHTVNRAATAINLASTAPATVFGQTVTFTATVTSPFSTPAGSVIFYSGATVIGTIPLNGSGEAALSIATLAPGPHSIGAEYTGTANFDAVATSGFAHTVTQASTTTTVVATANPSVFGQSVTFTATVSPVAPGGGTATGTVTFTIDGTPAAPVALAAGAATLTTSALATGGHTVIATYNGSAAHAASSGSRAHTVNQSATSTAVASSPNPSTLATSVTLTATVSATAPGSGARTGTVGFFDGATLLGSAAVNGSGQATLTTSTLAVGSHAITAVYNGDPNFTTSTSPAHTHTVNPAATTAAVVSATNPSVWGQSVTFTATVSSAAPGTPTGTVTFLDGVTSLGTVALASGQASVSTSALTTGNHSIRAAYSGDATFATSTSNILAQTVNQAATSTALVSSANPVGFAQPVTFTATVTVPAPGAGTPTGTVTFRDGATTLGSSTLNASGQATHTTSSLGGGARSITAVYNGDANFGASTSSSVAQVVNAGATTTTLAPVGGPGTSGQRSTFSATVTSPAGVPAGTVTFRAGTTTLGTVSLDSNGAASLGVSLGIGTHSISATYNGNANFAGSTSATASYTVNAVVTTTSKPVLRSGALVAGELLTFAATVTSDARPTGLVTFRAGLVTLGTAAVDSLGTAVITARLGVGQQFITARYEGDVQNAPSTSEELVLQIRGTATVRVTSSANPSAFGAAVTFTTVVAPPEAGAPVISGSVTFRDGATALGMVLLVNGQATFQATGLSAGEHTIVAAYSGDMYYAPSNSAALTQVVTRPGTTTVLTAGADATGYFLTATVAAQGPAGSMPGGAVQFEDVAGGAPLGSATLSNGSAMLRLVAPLPVGRRLRAVYGGDTGFAGSTSAALPFVAAANAFSFSFPSFGGDAIVSLFGAGFADSTVAAPGLPLPASLGGVSVNAVDGSGRAYPASLYFVSPGQINLVLPSALPAGPARLVVTNGQGTFSVPFLAGRTSPALAAGDGSGTGPAAAHILRVHADGSQDPLIAVSAAPVPFGAASDSLYLILYGTGFRNAQGTTSCSFNGQPSNAMFAGAHTTYPGLDQINLQVPGTLRGAGRVTVSCTVEGQTSNTISVNLQ